MAAVFSIKPHLQVIERNFDVPYRTFDIPGPAGF